MSTEFGVLPDGQTVHEVTISNDRIAATFLTFGARINALSFDGVSGLVPTYSLEAAANENPFSGVIVGPVMNRLQDARAPLGEGLLVFEANEGPNMLHSGDLGLHRKVWDIASVADDAVEFTLDLPPDAFPGQRKLSVVYRLEGYDLIVKIQATSDAATLMNTGWHPYFTLSGKGNPGHTMGIDAPAYLPMDGGNIPTGEIADVEGTPLDYREAREPSRDVDHCFVLTPRHGIEPAVILSSGDLTLDVLTDAPAVHVYTGHDCGIAVEPEIHPDAPNKPGFPSIELKPGEQFRQTSIYRFSRR